MAREPKKPKTKNQNKNKTKKGSIVAANGSGLLGSKTTLNRTVGKTRILDIRELTHDTFLSPRTASGSKLFLFLPCLELKLPQLYC